MNRADHKMTDILTADKIRPGMIVSNHQAQPSHQGLHLVADVQPSAMTDRRGRKLVRIIHDGETGNGWVFNPDHALSVYARKRGR